MNKNLKAQLDPQIELQQIYQMAGLKLAPAQNAAQQMVNLESQRKAILNDRSIPYAERIKVSRQITDTISQIRRMESPRLVMRPTPYGTVYA